MRTFKVAFMTGIFAAAITLAAHSASACGCGGGDENMSKEKRAEMASNHEKMAACLRSDSPMDQCQETMMNSCGDQGSCPMMSGKMGKMGGKNMKMNHKMHEEKTEEKK